MQIMLNGIHSGALYALLAYGYVLTYIVTKRANIAHGAMFAFSGQVLVAGTSFGYNVMWIILPLAIVFGSAVSVIISLIILFLLAKIVFPPLIQRAPNAMIAATLAISIILTESIRICASGRDLWLPPLFADQLHFSLKSVHASLTVLQVINVVIVLILITITEMFLTMTMLGRRIRAVSDDPLAASLSGVNVSSIFTLAIVSGGILATIDGQLAVIYYGNMSYSSGLIYGLKILFIASAGGFSRPLYAAAGAFMFAIAENLWDGYFPVIWREVVLYGALVALLCLRTEGQVNIQNRA